MSSWLISFQIDLVPSQCLIGMVFKSSRHSAIVSAGSYIVVMGLLFILGILAQVGAPPKEVGDTPRSPLYILHLGHLLRRPARVSNPSWRPNQIRARVCFGLQEQPALKWTPRSHTGSDLGAIYMVRKIIRRCFQWHQSQDQIHPESTGIVETRWRPESISVLHYRFSVFGPCIELSLGFT